MLCLIASLTWFFILVKLYKESVEETVQANVVIGGQDWNNVSQSEDSSISVVREGKLINYLQQTSLIPQINNFV